MQIYRYISKHWLILILCALGFALNLIAFYPGFISPDGLEQYSQALNNTYSDWHPPILAYTWHLLNYLHKGPQLMLAFQLTLLWLSCFTVASAFPRKLTQLIVFLVFLTAPFIVNFAGWIVKDTLMGLSWMLACSIMFHQAYNGRRSRPFLAAIVAILLLYGTWMRYNAITALLPLTFLWTYVFFSRTRLAFRVLCSLGLIALIAAGQSIFNNMLLKASKTGTEAQIYFHDLTGIFLSTHQNVYPSILYKNPDFDTNYIRAHFDPCDVTKVLWNADNKTIVMFSPEVDNDMKRSWLQAIGKYPAAYLKFRGNIALYFLNIRHVENTQYYYGWMHPNNYGFVINGNYLYNKYMRYMEKMHGRFFFKVWFWTLLSIVLFVAAFFLKNTTARILNLCLASSAFLYIAPQFLVSNSVTDFRYIYWACLACTLSLISFVSVRQRSVADSLT